MSMISRTKDLMTVGSFSRGRRRDPENSSASSTVVCGLWMSFCAPTTLRLRRRDGDGEGVVQRAPMSTDVGSRSQGYIEVFQQLEQAVGTCLLTVAGHTRKSLLLLGVSLHFGHQSIHQDLDL